jgi:hypothetical protein
MATEGRAWATPASESSKRETSATSLWGRTAPTSSSIARTSPVRYLMVSNRPPREAVEYPDTRQISVMAFTESQLGRPLWDIRTLEPTSE